MIKYAAIEGGEELAAVLRALPDALAKNALRSAGLAGAKVLQDAAYVALSSAVKGGGPRQADDVIIKQRRGKKGDAVQAEYAVGPPISNPSLRWLHDGTKAHTISAVMRHGTRRGARDTQIARVWLENGQAMTLRRSGRKVRATAMRAASVLVLADKVAGKFFGTTVRHPGQPPRPWLLQAQFTSRDQVFRAMADAIRKGLSRQVKRLVSAKYRGKQLRRIFS
jgi:hypothetical protein